MVLASKFRRLMFKWLSWSLAGMCVLTLSKAEDHSGVKSAFVVDKIASVAHVLQLEYNLVRKSFVHDNYFRLLGLPCIISCSFIRC